MFSSDFSLSIPIQFPAIDFDRFQNDENNNSDPSSKKSNSPPFSAQAEKMTDGQKIAAIDANLRRISVVSKESTFYGDDDDALIRVSASKSVELELSNGLSFNPEPCDVEKVQNTLPPSPPQKRPAKVKSTNKVAKSIDVDKKSIYDFADEEDDDEPLPKKPRGRGRRAAQPKKRAKPAPFPRVKSPPVERPERKFTIRAKTPVGPSAKTLSDAAALLNNGQVDPLPNKMPTTKAKRTPREKTTTTSSFATVISSGMDKLGFAVKKQVLVRQQTIVATGKKESLKKARLVSNNKVRESTFDVFSFNSVLKVKIHELNYALVLFSQQKTYLDAEMTANGSSNNDQQIDHGKATAIDVSLCAVSWAESNRCGSIQREWILMEFFTRFYF